MYGTSAKGARYLEMAEGYVTKIGLNSDDEIIGYSFVHLGKMMESVANGMDANEALRIRIGWTPGNPTTDEVFDVPPCVKRGAYVRVLQMDGFLITLEDVATKYSYKLPVTWLLPESTYARLEVYEAC